MSARSLSVAISLLLLGLSAPALAHPQVSGQVFIGDGPLSIGINLGPLLHQGHYHRRHHYHDDHHSHVHGPVCYRSYGHDHPHWGGHYPRHYSQEHYSRHHRQEHFRDHPGRGWKRHASRHKHGKDCYLHYPRGHDHWH